MTGLPSYFYIEKILLENRGLDRNAYSDFVLSEDTPGNILDLLIVCRYFKASVHVIKVGQESFRDLEEFKM